MKSKVWMFGGALSLTVALIVLLSDIMGASLLKVIIALAIFGISLLSGRKIAYLLHDSTVLKRRGGNPLSPSGMISLWMFFFIIAVIFYTLMSMMFFKSVGLLLGAVRSSYLGLVHSTLALLGSYGIFSYTSSRNPEKLYSSWGKRMEKMENMGKGMMGEGMKMMGMFR